MTNQPPSRNLPPDAEMWGRWVDQQLTFNAAETSRTLQTIGNSLEALNGTLARLSTQVEGLATQQAISSLSTTLFQNVSGVSLTATQASPQNSPIGPPVPVTLAPNSQATILFTSPVSIVYTAPFTGDGVWGGLSITSTASGALNDYRSAEYRMFAPLPNSRLDSTTTLTCVMNLQNRTTSSLSTTLQLRAYGQVVGTGSGQIIASNGSLLLQTSYLAPDAPSSFTL